MPRQLEYMTEPELAELMRGLADAVVMTGETIFDVGKPHFVLLIFNDPKFAQYISNCQRPEMIRALRETADRLERKQDFPR